MIGSGVLPKLLLRIEITFDADYNVLSNRYHRSGSDITQYGQYSWYNVYTDKVQNKIK